jgi:hypothetical protein
MPELSINDVVTAHSTWLLTQPGVTGFGVGDTIPKSLDGYPVKMVTSGPFEALE